MSRGNIGPLSLVSAFLLAVAMLAGTPAQQGPGSRASGRPVQAFGANGPGPGAEVPARSAATRPAVARITRAVRHDRSGPLREMRPVRSSVRRAAEPEGEVEELDRTVEPAVGSRTATATTLSDPVVQRTFGGDTMPAPSLSFKGLSNADNNAALRQAAWPPDPNGDIGAGYYVQMVNLTLAVYSASTGNRLLGPIGTNTLWSGLGGICANHNDGDPVVVFDAPAGRWMVSQFALGFPDNFHECIAVSKTSDPRGGWYRYDFKYSSTVMNDYPKFGVWRDGYYMSTNQFNGSTFAWAGAGAVVYERRKMLAGKAARQIYFNLKSISPALGGMVPTNFSGDTLPLAGAPNLFVQADDDAWGYPEDQLELWAFHTDWSNPGSSSFTLQETIPTASFRTTLCGSAAGTCIPQPDTNQKLDFISDRMMNRMQYRNFGDHQALVASHAVVAGPGQGAMRWYELRNAGSGWLLFQQGTYAPDALNRWMGSVAMDGSGDIALGYSAGNGATYPSVRYTGRLASDPPNTLPQGEQILVRGGGSQTGVERWGDYSSMSVDPSDDCTFWYTQEYYKSTSRSGWKTRIGSFRFPSCG